MPANPRQSRPGRPFRPSAPLEDETVAYCPFPQSHQVAMAEQGGESNHVVIAVLADTHMPRGTRRLPERCIEAIAAAEAVIHAGDFFAVSALEEVRALCPVIHAVHGNVDEAPLRRSLPARLEVEIGQWIVAVTHDAGPAKGRLARLRRSFPTADAVVFGHSHLPLHEVEHGFQIFNPGSPTERRRAPQASMGLLEPRESGLTFEHLWL